MTKQEFWKQHIQAQRASGLSQVKYCEQAGLNGSTFWNWSKRLGAKGKESEGKFVALSSRARIEVVVGDVVIRIEPGSDLSELRRIVEALRC
jgi:hypothetical protein